MLTLAPPYPISDFNNLPDKFKITDHLGGWDSNLCNYHLQLLDQIALSQGRMFDITYHQIISQDARDQYKNLKINFSPVFQQTMNFNHFTRYTQHPAIDYKNFICSFNGSIHVSRKLLVSILNRFGYFESKYCSKNFSYSANILDGHIMDYVGDRNSFYRKFFISDKSEDFFQTKYSFGHVQFDHGNNIYTLEDKLTESFLHIVSETMATSYVPFVTEKFLYSIVTRGLFLAYAQPGWHDYIDKYYGFKKYDKLFDYRFDTIQNPVERLVELMSMLSKFNMLTPHEWHDLYLIELDTIEYNYDHYFSKKYLENLQQYEN